MAGNSDFGLKIISVLASLITSNNFTFFLKMDGDHVMKTKTEYGKSCCE